MCEPRTYMAGADPGIAFSRLLRSKTGAEIEPRVLRLFLAAHWSKVSKLAHAVHEQETGVAG